MLAVNLTGPFLCTKAAVPLMREHGGGAIVNITSISAVRASTLRSAYGTSKAGLAHLTKQLAVELASLGIRVNGVAPGPVDTAMAKAVHTPEIRADYHDAIPLNRYGLEEELAEAIFFLCSDRSSYITGQILAVDGGFDAAGIGLPTLRGAAAGTDSAACATDGEHETADAPALAGCIAAPARASLVPARAEVRILGEPGRTGRPVPRSVRARCAPSGERVVIDGPCLSACTLVLSMVPDDRICVTRRAVLGFHAARSIDRRGRTVCRAGSLRTRAARPIPPRCASWIRRRGGLTSRLLLLRGRELAAIYPSVPIAPSTFAVGQLTIQGMPNWSTHMPNPLEKKVLPNGMLTLPPSHSALNLRSASAGSLTRSARPKSPAACENGPGGASDAISTWPSIDIRACMIFFFRSGGDGMSGGAPRCAAASRSCAPSTFS